jgi:hypothetical protein
MTTLSKSLRPLLLPALAAAVLFGASASAGARARVSNGDSYLGSVVQTNLGSRFVRFGDGFIHIQIDRYTSPQETQKLAALVARKGQDELRNVLGGQELGTVRIGSRLGQPIAAAWKTQNGPNEKLVLVVPRNVSIREVFGNRLSADYPYTIVELDLGPDGRGEGDLIATAKLKAGRDGNLEYQDLRRLPIRILNVQPKRS